MVAARVNDDNRVLRTGHAHMNIFQGISRNLVIERLKRHKDLRFAANCDPVTRQFVWQRFCRQQDVDDGPVQRDMGDEVKSHT
jgi:hypothetical protein